MKVAKIVYSLTIAMIALSASSIEAQINTQNMENKISKVLFQTTQGDIEILLYNDTPNHRDNFLKLVRDGYYDGTLFHRVIKDFMIQGGDGDSRTAKPGQHLGVGGVDYKLDAEILYPKHFHKKGALAAARQGDAVNPEKKSSGSQFYIVVGRPMTSRELDRMQDQRSLQFQQSIMQKVAEPYRKEYMKARMAKDTATISRLENKIVEETQAEVAKSNFDPKFTQEQLDVYSTIGGAPHLDGEYTVFGEVVTGMDVVEAISVVDTDQSDRPKTDVKIIKARVIE